jgi:hypothetical protein
MITTNLQFFIQTIINNQLKFFSRSDNLCRLIFRKSEARCNLGTTRKHVSDHRSGQISKVERVNKNTATSFLILFCVKKRMINFL